MANPATLAVRVTLNDEFSKRMSKMQEQVRLFSKSMMKNWTNIHFAVADASRAIQAGSRHFLSLGVDASAQMENYQMQLTTVLGSTQKASNLLEHIKRFAVKTPFEIPNLVEAAAALENIGLSAKKNLEIVGNTAAAFGRDITEVSTGLQSMQATVLRRYGVDVRRTAESATFIWRDMWGQMQERTIKGSFSVQREALLAIWNKRYEGGMERFQGTWDAMLSNIADAYFNFRDAIGKSGIFDAMKENIKQTLDMIERLQESGELEKFAKTVSDQLISIAKSLKVITKLIMHLGVGLNIIFNLLKAGVAQLKEWGQQLKLFFLNVYMQIAEMTHSVLSKLPVMGKEAKKSFANLQKQLEGVKSSLESQKRDWDAFGEKAKTKIVQVSEALTMMNKLMGEELEKSTKKANKNIEEMGRELLNPNNESKKFDQFKTGFHSGLGDATTAYGNFAASIQRATQKTVKSMEQTFSSFFSGALRGEIRNAQDLIVKFGNSMIDIMGNVLAQLSLFGFSGHGGLIGGFMPKPKGDGNVGAVPQGSSSFKPAAFDLGTPMVQSTGLAMVHRGEKIIPAHVAREEAKAPQVTVINVVDPKMITDVMASSEGGQVIVNQITSDIFRNGAVRQALKDN